MKILTNRLSSKLVENYNILKDHNYAGLPEKSTHEPIHILNAIMEEAREKKKELWILMQDMSKAYDLVNRNNLAKALKRIKLPNLFVDFIANSLRVEGIAIILYIHLMVKFFADHLFIFYIDLFT